MTVWHMVHQCVHATIGENCGMSKVVNVCLIQKLYSQPSPVTNDLCPEKERARCTNLTTIRLDL
jgi:hypothetical protein